MRSFSPQTPLKKIKINFPLEKRILLTMMIHQTIHQIHSDDVSFFYLTYFYSYFLIFYFLLYGGYDGCEWFLLKEKIIIDAINLLEKSFRYYSLEGNLKLGLNVEQLGLIIPEIILIITVIAIEQ